jgi:hypothetical protein
MVENQTHTSAKRRLAFKILKATAKAVILGVIYLFASSLLAPLSEMVPGLQHMLEAFVVVYIVLMVIGDLTSGTIYQHFFNAANALFVIGYMLFTLNGGVIAFNFENINLLVDLRILLTIVIVLGLVGFSKSILQAINYMNQKTETMPL